MFKNYANQDEVISAMQSILDHCAKTNCGIDGMALLLNYCVIARSQVSEAFDVSIVPALLDNLTETIQNIFSQNTKLKFNSCIIEDPNGQLKAWTVVTVCSSYKLVFTGKIPNESRLFIHLSSVSSYIETLQPLIEAYDKMD